MAAPELLLLSAGPFRAPEWDTALFRCHDDRLDHDPLFPSLDADPMFDCAFNGGEAATPPDPPWDLEPPNLFPALQVKAEPGSPPSPHCSSLDPPIRAPTPPTMGVKPEPPPPLRVCAPPEPGPGLKAEGPPPIQPRPPPTLVLQPVAITAPALLLPGLLCLPPPRRGPPRAPPRAEPPAIAPAPGPAPPTPPDMDPEALRRRRRLLRNREAAAQSRQRRRAHVRGLEQRLLAALRDNERLRAENAVLRRRLAARRTEVSDPGASPRPLFCLFLLLLLTLNLGPIGHPQPPPTDPPPAPPPRGRRHLLGVPEPPPYPRPPPKGPPRMWGPPRGMRQEAKAAPPPRRLFSNSSVPMGLLSDCQGLNRSENLRLAHELNGWVRRHQLDRRKPGPPPRPPRGQFQALPPRKLPTSNRALPTAAPRPERPPPAPFPAAISRREDTFYVVSFRRDHLLLPAISHNKTSRPKMSLVLPAAAINESLSGRGGGLEAMMQVDCEVMDTRVVHVRPPPPRARPPPRALYLGGARIETPAFPPRHAPFPPRHAPFPPGP